MGKHKYDWKRVVEISRELAAQANSYVELAAAVSSRLGMAIPTKTFSDGIRRELDTGPIPYDELAMILAGEEAPNLSPLGTALLALLQRKGREQTFTLIELCEMFDRSPNSVKAAVAEVHDAGYYISLSDDLHVLMPKVIPPTGGRLPLELWIKPATIHRFGVVSDTHLASRKARLDTLNALYEIFEEEGIEVVLHAGNVIDGECKWNRHELVAHGVEGQIEFCAKHYPQIEGITTRFISADDHEGWWGKYMGFDIGRYMGMRFHELGRGDLEWIGHVERDLELNPDDPRGVLRLMHPGGGTAYAISYKPQKIAESWQGGEKPAAAIAGHYHKAAMLYPREVTFILAGTVCDQTMFMRKKPLWADVGGSIVEIHMSQLGGVARVKYEFFPFFDKGFYQKWDYASIFEWDE